MKGNSFLCVSIALAGMISSANGAMIFEFDLTSGGSVDDEMDAIHTVVLNSLSADGVSFTATLTVTGSGVLDQTASTGLSVGSGMNPGEFMTFDVAISNQVGGSVTFDGFTTIRPFNITSTDEQGKLSLDTDVLNAFQTLGESSNGVLTPVSGEPTTLSVHGFDNMGVTSSFRIDRVDGRFTGTAVPEPSSFLFGGGLAMLLIGRRSRKRSLA